MRRICFAAMALLVFLVGCSPNWPHAYHNIEPKVVLSGTGNFLVVAEDQRPAVLEKNQAPTNIGSIIPLVGAPFDAKTASGKGFASDLSTAVCNGLQLRKQHCQSVSYETLISPLELGRLANLHNADRVLRFIINKWTAKTFTRTTVTYDIKLEVYTQNAKLLAKASMVGESVLGIEVIANPAENASKTAPLVLQTVIEELLNDKNINSIISADFHPQT